MIVDWRRFFLSAGHFGINSRSGEVSTAARLDRETQDYYLLTVTVTDSATLPHSVHTTININISDYNDNSPIFNPLDSFITIPEVRWWFLMRKCVDHAIVSSLGL